MGNDYDPRTGTFTAPVNGTYVVSFHGVAYKSKSIYLHLKRNGVKIASGYGPHHFGYNGRNHDYLSASNTAVVNLEHGDKLWVDASGGVYGTGTELGGPSNYYTTFSGYLIFQ